MQTLPFELHDARSIVPVEAIRSDLRRNGVAVVKLYDSDDPTPNLYENAMNECATMLRADGGTPHGSRGMGGITKRFGAGSHPGVARARLDPKARLVHASIYGVPTQDVCTGWDAVGILGTDAVRKSPARTPPDDPMRAYFDITGGSLQAHVDVGRNSHGSRMETAMAEIHPVFSCCVQSFLVCRTIPRGGATLVISPGPWYDRPVLDDHFEVNNGRDFCIATERGYAHHHNAWYAVDDVPRGCLVLWISRAPHGNKMSDVGVDPQRRVVYISWQSRALVSTEEERVALVRRKLDAILSGGTTDHWATHVPKIHRGSHYSNGRGVTNVIFTAQNPPQYDDDLMTLIEEAL
jgi:hypothetical protein